MAYAIFRLLHLLGIIGLAGALVIENMAIKRRITSEDASNLAKVNKVLGICAIAVLLFGLALWLWVGKPAEFYSANPVFWVKLGLFGFIFVISLYPSVFFQRNRAAAAESIEVPAAVVVLIRTELILLAIIPILALMITRGIGLSA